jgi:hypothetical protein
LLSPKPRTPTPGTPHSSHSRQSSHSRNSSSPLPSPISDRSGVRRTASVNSQSSSPRIGLGFSTSFSEPKLPSFDSTPPRTISTLADIGLRMDAVSSSLSLSRNSQPLCGAILDDKYLLIGTTSGLEFLPFAQRPDIKRPISLLKRVRFKSIVVLKERSNIMLAVAGRNDHVRGGFAVSILECDLSGVS